MKALVPILMCLALASPRAEAEPTGGEPNGEWLTGFTDGLLFTQRLAHYKNLAPATCLPDGFTGAQAQRIVEGFLQDHPEELHHSAVMIAGVALVLAFPCEGSK